jgi:hypothetical protein
MGSALGRKVDAGGLTAAWIMLSTVGVCLFCVRYSIPFAKRRWNFVLATPESLNLNVFFLNSEQVELKCSIKTKHTILKYYLHISTRNNASKSILQEI